MCAVPCSRDSIGSGVRRSTECTVNPTPISAPSTTGAGLGRQRRVSKFSAYFRRQRRVSKFSAYFRSTRICRPYLEFLIKNKIKKTLTIFTISLEPTENEDFFMFLFFVATYKQKAPCDLHRFCGKTSSAKYGNFANFCMPICRKLYSNRIMASKAV